jgi:FkbM family methyltransferase
VHAFEPFPPNADLLERSIAESGLGAVVQLERLALGREPGELRLLYAPDTVNPAART